MTISELYTLYKQHPIITTDSRTCEPGSIFFALKGESFNGNMYADKAIQTGCSYAVIDDTSVKNDPRMIVVDNVLDTLQQLARLHRQTLGTKVIGITGSNGKTTTKELTSAVLSQKYNTLYTLGNLNNHIGVPLTLLRLTNEHDIAVIEMGANHPGEIRELANIAMPDFGIITNVGYAHLEGFGSFEGVIRTKGELYDYIRATEGKVFIDKDNNYLTGIAEGLNLITYGDATCNSEPSTTQEPFIGGHIVDSQPYLSFQWQINGDSCNTYNTKTNLVGNYNLRNALAAIAMGVYFDVTPEQINSAIESYEPTNNRSQLKETANNTLIIDAYNANPSSMQAALENFSLSSDCQSAPKAIILGDMRELGDKSLELHASIVALIDKCNFRKVIFCGEHFSATGQKYQCFYSVEELSEYLESKPLQGYTILIKGSRGAHLEKIIDKL